MTTIFVLDDDKSLLYVLNILMTTKGYEVHTFDHSKAFFLALDVLMPDFILLDVLLSEEEDGKSVCAKIKQDYQYPHLVYLFSATSVSDEDAKKCGADGFIEKPFDITVLMKVISEATSHLNSPFDVKPYPA